jgi:OOP family OmpA-OmpF porin
MKQIIITSLIVTGALLSGGCATKKYVNKTVDPVSGKLDQVAQQTTQQGQSIDQTKQSLDQTKQSLDQTRQSLDQTRATLEKDESNLNATNERAVSAGNRADDANRKAEQVGRDVGDLKNDLKNTIANLDDYKQVAETTINFKFNSDKLSSEAKQSLDQMVANQNQYKRFFIAVEGFTDLVGSADYNEELSRRRANAVVEYLVAEHSIPIYRVHMVGLGKMKPVDEGKTRAANAKNRRVEVALYSADQSYAMTNQPAAAKQ